MAKRLAICATHPIQYQVPIFRALAKKSDVEVKVFYLSDHSVRGDLDAGFGVGVSWDVPLLEGYDYVFLPNRGKANRGRGILAYNCPQIAQELIAGQFDALLLPAYGKLYYLQAIRAALKANIPILLRVNNLDGTNVHRSAWRTIIRRVALRRLYSRMGAFLAIGQYMRRHYLQHGVSNERIVDTPYCVNDRLFERQREKFCEQRDAIRKELNIPKESLVLIYSGRMIPWKNTLLIAKAISMLPSKRGLYFIGMGDGGVRDELAKAMHAVLGEQVHFTGFVNQSQLGRYYTAADVLVLPSKRGHETWGLVVNEAMTFGLPAIVSDGVGCRDDLVIDGQTGFIFTDGDAPALAQHIRRLVQDRALGGQMGRNARKLIGHYNIENNITGIRQALNAVITQ